jgi:uroporphyrinogen decarboxylase
MNLENDLLIRAARGEKTERTPVWVMRQAGRILSEYRATRAVAGSFIGLVKNPALAAEVTVQPVDILGVDAAIIFSDILVIPEAMGLPYQMDEGKGPSFPNTIRNREDLEKLDTSNIASHLDYVTQAIEETLHRLQSRVPLIGFAGAPWTIFCYMIEGKGSKEFSLARKMLVENPELSNALLSMITDATIQYMNAQVKAGIHLFQLFDSWAGVLNPSLYASMIQPHVERIITACPASVPTTYFAKGGYFAAESIQSLSCQVVGLDWTIHPADAKLKFPNKTLQGNLDPAILYGTPESIERTTMDMLAQFDGHPHIANLGHGVYPDIDPKKLKIFIETIQKS